LPIAVLATFALPFESLMEIIQNFINGSFSDPVSGLFFDNINPATGKVYGKIPDSDAEDVQAAVVAAKEAFEGWKNTPATDRMAVLSRLADLIAQNAEELARAESRDNGKPISLARTVDIPRAESNIRFFATAIAHFASESHGMEDRGFNYTTRKPIGVVGCISPWNLPLYLFTWKIAPALAAGNCVVAKPSEITPLSAHLFAGLCARAGIPAGVMNIVHGFGHKAGAAMVNHPDVKAISFTGGTKTGAYIAATAAPRFKKLSLELGGKNPNIIFADCDFDKMLTITVRSSFANQGQICLCGSRIYIERPIYEKFKTAFLEKVRRIVPGNPADDNTKMGALVSKDHMEKVLSYIDLAKSEGGTVLTGGHRVILDGDLSGGFYLAPTVIEGLNETCRTNTEEIFGPVVTLQPFDNEDEAIRLANSSEYGLSATIWTQNLNRAHRVADSVEAGIVWINCWLVRDLRTPFGGVKNSGVGREGGWEALRFFTEPKNICVEI